jgi:hypothetical protein
VGTERKMRQKMRTWRKMRKKGENRSGVAGRGNATKDKMKQPRIDEDYPSYPKFITMPQKEG